MRTVLNSLIALTAALTLHTTATFAAVFTTNATIGVGIPTYDGQDIVVSNCTLTVNGAHNFASLALMNSAVLTHAAAPAGETNNRLDLTIAGDVTIDATSRIDTDAKGYGQNAGPGRSVTGNSGAGHGGLGSGASHGNSGGTNYGSLLQPALWGSGGGPGYQSAGGNGGGLVHLAVSGTLTVNGTIRGNGQNGATTGCTFGGGGSGGSIWIEAGTLTGGGSITANGGNGYYSGCSGGYAGAGGGGRIAAYFTASSFTGSITALGADGYTRSAAGTIYLKAAGLPTGTVLVDNGDTVGGSTPISTPVAFNLIITNHAVVYPEGALTLANLTVATNGLLTHLPAQSPGLDLTVAGNVTIEAGGVISADAKGYASDTGPGANVRQFAGGGYGGVGGRSSSYNGGAAYGSITEPTQFGSGGGYGFNSAGGSGGGLIRLTVGGTLTVNGALRADGQNGATTGCTFGGGGSGGSVLLMVGTLTGAGSITAKGGEGYYGSCSGGYAGGGGGGRIALYYQTGNFAGAISATGGSGNERGGAGTIYTKATSSSVGEVLVDNGGTNGAMTLLTSPVAFNVTITNAAVAYSAAPVLFNNLVVAAGGTVTHLPALLGVQITCLSNLTIESGGMIAAQGKGYSGNVGPGTAEWGGAGYGGRGGAMVGIAGGGAIYGSATQPLDFGSGGGYIAGGSGGGLIRLTVAGQLIVNGAINASGNAGSQGGCTAGSGGSGGSVYLTVGELTGSGSISANGGSGWYSGCSGITSGGGGGGRMAVYGTISSIQSPVINIAGAGGGETGSYYTSTNVPPMVIAQYPSGSVNRFVSYVDVTFNQPVDPATFTTNDVIVTTPAGPVPASQIALTGGGGPAWRIGFPTQMANGDYSIQMGPHIANLFGQEMETSYSGGFTLNFTTPTTTASQTGGNLSMIWSSATGLSYQLQSATNLTAASWLNEGAPLNGTGGLLTNSLPIGAQPGKFFRFLILEN